jgi:HAMP domain-containing protein
MTTQEIGAWGAVAVLVVNTVLSGINNRRARRLERHGNKVDADLDHIKAVTNARLTEALALVAAQRQTIDHQQAVMGDLIAKNADLQVRWERVERRSGTDRRRAGKHERPGGGPERRGEPRGEQPDDV